MHHVPVTIAPAEARELWRAYKQHVSHALPIDREILHAYQKLAQGKLVIRALESITTAGADANGMPKLAIARADAKLCHLTKYGDGSAQMAMSRGTRRGHTTTFNFPPKTFPGGGWRQAEALVPPVPLHLRPKRALQAYQILWEVEEWSKAPPSDPFLLRRIGKGDLFIVCAMWDLTPVEKAALAARL